MTLVRLADLVRPVAGFGTTEGPSLALDDFESGTGLLREGVNLEPAAPPASGVVGFETGDLLFGKLRPYLAKAWVADRDGYASTELIVMRPVRSLCDPRWLGYLAMSAPFLAWAIATSDGAKMPRTSWESLREFPITLPSLQDQATIADLLDVETVRIARLLAAKRRLTLLLAQHKVARVSDLTAAGRTVAVRYLTSLRTSGPRGWGDLVGTAGEPFIRAANLNRDTIALRMEGLAYLTPPPGDEARRSRVQEGDVLVGITGANTGYVGVVPSELAGGYVSQHVAILRPAGVVPEWLAYSIASHRSQSLLVASQYGGTKQQLGLDDLAELEVTAPDLADQERVAQSLTEMAHQADSTIALLRRQVDLVIERRKALVTATLNQGSVFVGAAA